jgi:hypothetical protein
MGAPDDLGAVTDVATVGEKVAATILASDAD